MSKMLNASEVKPGRIYTFEFADDAVEMSGFVYAKDGNEFKLDEKGKRIREENPLAGCAVSVSRVAKYQAAGKKTWERMQKAKNPNWTPSADYVQWWHVWYSEAEMAKPEAKRNSAVLEHNETATRYLRAIPRGVLSEAYTIDNKPATAEQIATVRKFKKNKGGSEFCMLTLEKLNVRDDTDDSELED